ncbi:MAG TPA: hypothetical protein H9723_04920 [Candidatus Mediterraneibacter stercoravium]|uniref:Uncharacterized protein n=1 Tax=Candidatus Mediterraneibacter stercoravium TaxID=2838685 RepID=A0A9D2K2B9_9FIRM|nr:hypothetical protein [Candidatus Mediterraneibacter stercoravium]
MTKRVVCRRFYREVPDDSWFMDLKLRGTGGKQMKMASEQRTELCGISRIFPVYVSAEPVIQTAERSQ